MPPRKKTAANPPPTGRPTTRQLKKKLDAVAADLTVDVVADAAADNTGVNNTIDTASDTAANVNADIASGVAADTDADVEVASADDANNTPIDTAAGVAADVTADTVADVGVADVAFDESVTAAATAADAEEVANADDANNTPIDTDAANNTPIDTATAAGVAADVAANTVADVGVADVAFDESVTAAINTPDADFMDCNHGRDSPIMEDDDRKLPAKAPDLPPFEYNMNCGSNDVHDDDLFSSPEFFSTIKGGEEAPKATKHCDDDVDESKDDYELDAPVKPDYDGMSPKRKRAAQKEYQRERKKYTDKMLRMRRKAAGGKALLAHNIEYSGDNTSTLRPMRTVLSSRLENGDTFVDKDILKLRIAEEANLRRIQIRWKRSDLTQVIAVGEDFFVSASLNQKKGWVVKQAQVRDGDDGVAIPAVPDSDDDSEDDDDSEYSDDDGTDDEGDDDDKVTMKKLRTPMTSKWLVPLIKSAITAKPGCSNSDLHHILAPYCRCYALTRSILQSARSMAREAVFGSPAINAQYIFALKEELEKRGNHVDIMLTNHAEALRRLKLVVISDEIQRRKDNDEPVLLDKAEAAMEFIVDWSENNKDFIVRHFGTENDNFQFITGILFAPSTVRTCEILQPVYQADAAHLDFGKYTLFSAYGTTANSNASPLAFAIMFGNEDTQSWIQFWTFVKELHPWINHKSRTIITDQDKGSKKAIQQVLPRVANFHCSWHRRGNIGKVSISMIIGYQ